MNENQIQPNTLLQNINNIDLSNEDNTAILGQLLNLPDDQFALLAPTCLEELEDSFNDPNSALILTSIYNALHTDYETLQNGFLDLCEQLDENIELQATLSAPKRNFIKRLVGIILNSTATAKNMPHRIVNIPIELCNKDAKLPTYAHLTDAGMDIYALEDITIAPGETKLIPTGIKVAIPKGYELQVRAKSGRCLKTKLRVANQPGTLDSGYRGEVGVIIDNIEPYIKSADMDDQGRLYNVVFGSSYTIGKGEKFAQLVLNQVPKAAWVEVDNVDTIEGDGRGAGGYGSSGLK